MVLSSIGRDSNETELENLLSLAQMVLWHDSQFALRLTQKGFIRFKYQSGCQELYISIILLVFIYKKN